MYEMVTGHVPYDGETTVEVAVKHLQEAFPRPSDEVDIPYSLECIIMKCTQKNTSMRYKDCQELITDLKRSLVDPNGSFVMNGGGSSNQRNRSDATVVMSTGEIERVNRRKPRREEYDDDYDDDYEDDYPKKDNRPVNRNGQERNNPDRNRSGKNSNVDPNTKQIMKILMIVAAVIIAFAILFMVGSAVGVFKSVPSVSTEDGETVIVPSVVGMTEEQAKKTLNKEGLGYDVEARETSDVYKKGEIIRQSVDADEEIEKNTTIYVVVSIGEEVKTTDVPDVVGMDEDKAKKALDDKELVVDTDYKFDSSVESGKVISTDPVAGTEVDEGTKIKMYVSKGAETTKVPNVKGKTSAQAQQEMANAGLYVSITEEYNNNVDAGYVISQSEAGGTKVEKGSTISIVVSLGKEVVTTTVPDVRGDTKSSAESRIRAAGLVVSVTEQYDSTVPAGQVISQSLAGGTSVEEGTTVTITVSLGPDPSTTVPDDSGNSDDVVNSGSEEE